MTTPVKGLAAGSLAVEFLAAAACSARSRADSSPSATTASGPAAESAAPIGTNSGQPGSNGPGLRRSSTDTLQLPVPRTFDLSHIEPGDFAAALGKDPSRIFEYVRDNIAFEPYVGLLRGPRGTLLAMAGNSADRASLLASLLASSGQRIRYAHGTLPAPMAQQLVASMWAERSSPAPSAANAVTPDVNAAGERFMAGLQRDSTLLRDTLKKAGYPTGSELAVTSESLLKEARDHYWVQLWQNGAWTDMDPLFEDAAPGQVFAKAEQTFDALPEALFHRIEVRVRLEEYPGETPATREVLRSTATSAELAGAEITLIHVPQDSKNQGTNQVTPILTASG